MNAEEIKKAQIEVGKNVVKKKCMCMGVEVFMHSMSSTQHERYMEFCTEQPYLRQAKMIQICMHDEDGKQVWGSKEVPILGSYKIDEEAITAALEVNGWGPEGEEGILKNLPATPGDDGSSEQPESTESQSPPS